MLAVIALVVSVVVLGGLALARPASQRLPQSAPQPSRSTAERGDPVLAGQLAERARSEASSNPQSALRLFLAAHVVAPDRATHRLALAQAVLPGIEPAASATAAVDEPVDYAALSSDASFLLTSGPSGASLWQIDSLVPPMRLQPAGNLGAAVTSADAAGTLMRTTLVTTGGAGAFAWHAFTPTNVVQLASLDTGVSMLAVSGDGANAVTVQGTTATVWDLSVLDPSAQATFAYDSGVTALAFAPGSAMVLAAGHADGITVHTIDLRSASATARELSGASAVNAVAVSEDASTLAAISADGTLSVWSLGSRKPQPVSTTRGAVAPGPHRLWVSHSGDFAFVSDASGAPSMWSLADPAQPTLLVRLAIDPDQSVPAMISADGATVATISQTNTVTIWSIHPILDVIADPVNRACELAGLTEHAWRAMVPDAAYPNPCAPPTLPTLRVDQ